MLRNMASLRTAVRAVGVVGVGLTLALTSLSNTSLHGLDELQRVSATSAVVPGQDADQEPGEAEGESSGKPKLFVRYETSSPCTVYLNYPKQGVRANDSFTIDKGRSVIWRYNVNKNWALISDPHRAHKQYPWWGFTKRDCIGKSIEQKNYPKGVSVPKRILQGRSHKTDSGWRPVDFSPSPAPVAAPGKKVTSNATLRDKANFVIGNVPAGWHVDVTNKKRGNGAWVLVHVSNAKRWGYILSSQLN